MPPSGERNPKVTTHGWASLVLRDCLPLGLTWPQFNLLGFSVSRSRQEGSWPCVTLRFSDGKPRTGGCDQSGRGRRVASQIQRPPAMKTLAASEAKTASSNALIVPVVQAMSGTIPATKVISAPTIPMV